MNKKHRINREIYQTLSQSSLNHFSVIGVRNSIQANSSHFGNSNNARLYVSRQLHLLEKLGLMSSKGSGRSKVFSKTALFHETEFELVDKRSTKSQTTQRVTTDQSAVGTTLEKEKHDIEAELTVTLAEIDEYKKLMNRSEELSHLLKPSYLSTTRKSALLLAKLNVWSDALRVIQENKDATC